MSEDIPVMKNFTVKRKQIRKSSDQSTPLEDILLVKDSTLPESSESKQLSILQNFDESQQKQENKIENIQNKETKSSQEETQKNKTVEEEWMIDADADQNTIVSVVHQGEYSKKPSARERPTICPICYRDVPTHFTRHLFRHHDNNEHVIKIKSKPPKCKERLALIAALRKQGYFYLKTEKNISNPVRSSKKTDVQYFVCTYCLGQYTKKLLYKHVKICKQKPASETNPGKNCLNKSQSFLATLTSKNQNFLQSARIKEEVFSIIRADEISYTAKSDTLICLYGEALLCKHKRQQIATVISNKMREMGRLLIVLKRISNSVDVLFDALKPENFQDLICATKEISGYDPLNKCYKSPSLALHMGTNLKTVCDIALKLVIENRKLPKINWENRDKKKQEIKDLQKLIKGHWCNEVSSFALKILKERQWEKPKALPLTSDIQAFQTHVSNLANQAYEELKNNSNLRTNYRTLTECVLALTVMFNRRRVGDVQYLRMDTYNKNEYTINEEAFTESLTNVEKLLSQKFKRVVTGGKGSKPIPILFPPQIQKYIKLILEIREHSNIVPKSNPYLFANPGSENKWMAGYHVIRKLATGCGATNPSLLSSTRFRKHIATTLQLMTMDENEMEQIATFMGHTKKTHTEFYRLPQDIFQTAKVAKVLMLLEKGRGRQFVGKSLDEIEIDNDMYLSSDDEDCFYNTASFENVESEEFSQVGLENAECTESTSQLNAEPGPSSMEPAVKKGGKKIKPCGRVRWTETEKKIVTDYFKLHIQKKITPKKHECDELLAKHADVFVNKDWVRIKTFVYNVFRQK
ncbi:uncharacterized protein LOC135143317 [Zophobas morio]|uniref:uncharacterized protein LOC135143317 n=1 Tax=Zophobas morio TaxID=2755281 RepID=UPI00308399CF